MQNRMDNTLKRFFAFSVLPSRLTLTYVHAVDSNPVLYCIRRPTTTLEAKKNEVAFYK